MEAAWCGWRSAYSCTPNLKAPFDSPIASIRTPCYFYIPVVLLCPRDTQHSRLAAGLSLAPGHCLSLPHSRAHGEAAAERVVGLSSPASTDFFSALFMGIFNSNVRRYFLEASQRGYNLSLSAQRHRRRAGNNVTEIISHELGPISRQIRTYFVGQLYKITLDRRVPTSIESL